MLHNRIEAGELLSDELLEYADDDCIIIGIPRGGAIAVKCIADRLNKFFDIIVPRKIGSPFNKEIAIGAITQDGCPILNHKMIEYYNISREYLDNECKNQIKEINRRLLKYKGTIGFPDVSGKIIILVDDGISTGFTFIAAINSIKKHNAAMIIAAVPVATVEAIDMIGEYVDEVVCIESPKSFISVGNCYAEFDQNTDEEIIDLFRQNNNKMYI